MSDTNQTLVPRSFIELFIPPGKVKPTQSQAAISQRHEFCDDLAQMLTEHASTLLFDLGVTEDDVLERVHRGLLTGEAAGDAVVSADEAWWVVHRLAELLGWPDPEGVVLRPA